MQIKRSSNPRRRAVTGRSALPGCCRWRCSSARLNHVCFMFLLLCLPFPFRFLDPILQPFLRRRPFPRTSLRCLFSVSRVHRVHFYSILFFSFQMVQAIQVLRFHLLELEKVSILLVCITRLITLLPIQSDDTCICAMPLLQFISSLSKFISLSLHRFNIKKKFLSKLLQPSYLIIFCNLFYAYICILFSVKIKKWRDSEST